MSFRFPRAPWEAHYGRIPDEVVQQAMNDDKSTRPVGRPREFDGTPVSVRLPAALHDALSREALRDDKTLATVIRERLSVSQNSLKR